MWEKLNLLILLDFFYYFRFHKNKFYINIILAGIYIHIPFCKQKCAYCDFYSIANKLLLNDYIESLINEIELGKENFNNNQHIETIYFGGGTPSILRIEDIEDILNKILNNFKISANPEITFEANPENLREDYMMALLKLGINRLSIGIQSFNDEILKFMKRRHTADDAIISVILANKIGFKNISTDLIYGFEGLSNQYWKYELETMLNLPITHLSAYHLGIEENTLFYKYLKEGKMSNIDEEISFQQYEILSETTNKFGFYQYEISNFAKNTFVSKHNSNYWNMNEYLGFGASAHSFFDNTRQWNISSVKKYIEKIKTGQSFYEFENLSKQDKINESIMLQLRTIKGLDIVQFRKDFGEEVYNVVQKKITKINSKYYSICNNHLKLTNQGMFVSNKIIEDLFVANA